MTTDPTLPPDPAEADLDGLLLDAVRGELDAEQARRLQMLSRSQGARIAARRQRLAQTVARLQTAHEARPDPELARVLSARVRAEIGAEEALERPTRGLAPARWRLTWGRVLAASVAVHVLVLGILAVRARSPEPQAAPGRISVSLPEPELEPWATTSDVEPPSPWLPGPGEVPWPAPRPSPLATAPPDASPLDDLAPLTERRHAHPPGLLLPMLARTEDALKRHRLEDLGQDADRTLAAVRKGLEALAQRQAPEGPWSRAAGRSEIGQTALVLLPFLADGHGSRTGAYGPGTVAPAVAWLRARLFEPDGTVVASLDLPADEMGCALKALSEDYMLSYGQLLPRDGGRRGLELAALTARVAGTQAADGSFAGTGGDVRRALWPMWGLEAAARTGAVLPPAAVAERFADWFERRDGNTASDDAVGLLLARHLGPRFGPQAGARVARLTTQGWQAETEPFLVATAGSALLRTDPAAFVAWSRGLDERLARSVLLGGVVRGADPLGDTALVLLALQTAYRTY